HEQAGQITAQEAIIVEKDAVILEQKSIISRKEAIIHEQAGQIAAKEAVVVDRDAAIRGKDSVIRERESEIIRQDTVINLQRNIITAGEGQIRQSAVALAVMKNSVTYKIGNMFVYPFRRLQTIIGSWMSVPRYSIDTVNGTPVYNKKSRVVINDDAHCITVQGWAVDSVARNIASGVYLELGGHLFKAQYGSDRYDVALLYDIPQYKASGFYCEIPTAGIPRTTHKLSLKVLTSDGRRCYHARNRIKIIFNR
ncbi:MAG: hypothetical protein PHS37_01185, partial [Candidatus Omnitrophica bacterium]|nr:hypothetical protein [Candidatus Omnitrophota bacterium]